MGVAEVCIQTEDQTSAEPETSQQQQQEKQKDLGIRRESVSNVNDAPAKPAVKRGVGYGAR